MTTQMEPTSSQAIGDVPTLSKKDFEGEASSGKPVLDKEGNVIPDSSYKSGTQDKYGQVSPIPRLAKVAAFGRPVPTAGGYAIDNLKIDPQRDLKIPPECFLYDEDRPWVLGKLNPEALGVPEPADPVPLSQKTLDYLDALDEAYFAEMAELRKQEEARQNAEEARQNAEEARQKAEEELAANPPPTPKKTVGEKPNTAKDAKNPKSRNASVSPAKGARRPSTGRSSTSPSKRTERPLTGRQKTPNPKSPGRGVSPQAKIVPSSGPKKVMNAKVDVEVVEKKN